MMLSDGAIIARHEKSTEWPWLDDYRGTLVEPYDRARVQPCSYDLTLGEDLVLRPWWQRLLLMRDLHVLSFTLEKLTIPDDIGARIEGKSTWGRLGVIWHLTAGFIDAGFVGHPTLEVINFSFRTKRIKRGTPVAQVCFFMLDAPALRPYGSEGLGSHYQDQPARAVPAYPTPPPPDHLP